MFFNEFKLLDLKIAEQMDYVDKMIIVEAERTHTNKNKKVLLFNNDKYNHPKLEKVLVKANEFTNNSFHNEGHQRNRAMIGRDISDDDIIISCDLDELLPAKEMERLIDKIRELEYIRFNMPIYYYKINMLLGENWTSSIGLTGKFFKQSCKTLTRLRHKINESGRKPIVVKTLGKHFSYLASPEEIQYKLNSFVHASKKDYLGNRFNVDIINELIENKKDLFRNRDMKIVPIDETYPDTIKNNLDDWKEWIAWA
jgi:hypothetical protein